MENHRGLALVIGINDYDQHKKLDHAVNDAKAIANKLQSLGFDVIAEFDIEDVRSAELLDKFNEELKKYPLGIFFYAGHGVEIEHNNLLLMRNAPNTELKNSIKHFSIDLQDVVNDMCERCQTNILIIDACRDNPGFRSLGLSTSMAPIDVPAGTMIAYSTSPGHKAKDYGMENHSVYTGAILKHLEEEGLEIEMLFKKVRATVSSLTGGEQITWEHTSLLGKVCLNPGRKVNLSSLGYSYEAIADKNYNNDIISRFRAYNYDIQEAALAEFEKSSNNDPNMQFVIGRNILQAAVGNCWACQRVIKNEYGSLEKYTDKNGYNHVLNGILFEIYFNSNGEFRYHNFKSDYINEISELSSNPKFTNSFEFIKIALSSYSNNLLFIPTPERVIANFELKLDKYVDPYFGGENGLCITSLVSDNKELITTKKEDGAWGMEYSENLDVLKKKLSKLYSIPYKSIAITSNIENPKDIHLGGRYILDVIR